MGDLAIDSITLADFADWHGEYQGGGTNHEGEQFTASAAISAAGGGNALCLEFTAWSVDGEVLHGETSLIAWRSDLRRLCLAQTCSNIRGITVHDLADAQSADAGGLGRAAFLFGGEDDGLFRQVLALTRRDNGSLEYRFAWALPGETVSERSFAVMAPVEDET
jgi:hypothetical protein